MNRFLKFLKQLDYFSDSITFKYKGTEKYHTVFGTIIATIIYVFGIISLFYFSKDFFYRENPKVIVSEGAFEKAPEPIYFKKNEIFFALAMYSEETEGEILDESIFTVKSYFYITQRTNNNQVITYQNLTMEPCSQNNILQTDFAKKFFSQKPISNYYCLKSEDYEKMKILGEYDESYSIYFYADFYRCINATTSSTVCKPSSEIETLFQESYLEVFFLSRQVDPSNYKNPTKPISTFKEFYFKNNEIRLADFELKFVELTTDNGWFIEDSSTQRYTAINNIQDSVHSKTGNSAYFAEFQIHFTKAHTSIKRSYDKIPEIIAEVGGILGMIFFVGKGLINPIEKLELINEILNSFYYFKMPENEYKEIKESEQKKKSQKKSAIVQSPTQDWEEKIENLEMENSSVLSPDKIKEEKDLLYKVKTSLFELFELLYCKRKKVKNKTKKLYLQGAIDEFYEKADFGFLLKMHNEFQFIKTLIFDENQIRLIHAFYGILLTKESTVDLKKELGNLSLNFDEKEFKKAYEAINEKIEKSDIDEKLIDKFKFDIDR